FGRSWQLSCLWSFTSALRALGNAKRQLNANLPCPTSRPTQKNTGLICRREENPMTTLPERFERLGFAAGQSKPILLRTPLPHCSRSFLVARSSLGSGPCTPG